MAIRALTCVAMYIAASATLIMFNKYLMDRRRFPHAMALASLHMAFTLAMSLALYFVKPQLFPCMAATAGRRCLVAKWFIPLGMMYAVSLFCATRAYLYCSPAFLQFMKETNIVIVFVFSCVLGLQGLTSWRVLLIAWIALGACVAVSGEVEFVLAGFTLQVVSCLCEACKSVTGDWLMNGGSLRLDPLTYTLFISPACLAVLVIGNLAAWDLKVVFADVAQWWHLILPNTVLAFLVNVAIAVVIKECSAVALVLSGLVKDVIIVVLSTTVFSDGSISKKQCAGFVVCISGVLTWSITNAYTSWQAKQEEEAAKSKGELDPLLPKSFDESLHHRSEDAPEDKSVGACQRLLARHNEDVA